MRKLNKYKNFFSLFSQNGSEKIRQNKLCPELRKSDFPDLTDFFGAVLREKREKIYYMN